MRREKEEEKQIGRAGLQIVAALCCQVTVAIVQMGTTTSTSRRDDVKEHRNNKHPLWEPTAFHPNGGKDRIRRMMVHDEVDYAYMKQRHPIKML